MSEIVNGLEYCIPEEHDFQHLSFSTKLFFFILVSTLILTTVMLFGMMVNATISVLLPSSKTNFDTHPNFILSLIDLITGIISISILFIIDKIYRSNKGL